MPHDVFPTTPKVTVTREPIKGPPAPQVVRIYHKDGSHLDVFPIDAKEIVAGGEYGYEPPTTTVRPPPDASTEDGASPASLSTDITVEPESGDEVKPQRRSRSRTGGGS